MREFVRLADRVEVTMGRQRSPRHRTGAHVIPYLRAANVKDGELDLASVLEMNFEPKEQGKFCLRPGDVLVTEGCGSLAQIGASARWDSQLEGPVGFQNTLLRLRAIAGVTDPEFVYHWSRWAYSSGQYAATATGTSIFHIGSKRAEGMLFPDVSLEEQRRIADVIGVLDAARAGIAARHESLMRSRRAFLESMAERFAPSDSEVLSSLADVQSGISWSKEHEVTPGTDDGIGVMGVANVQRDFAHADGCGWIRRSPQASSRAIQPHTILTIRTNGNAERIGNVHLAPAEAVGFTISSFLTSITPHDPADAAFVVAMLQSPQVQRAITDATSGSTGLKNVAVTWMRALRIPWPDASERRHISEIVSAFDGAVAAQRRLVAYHEILRRAVLSALLSGVHEIPASYDRFVPENGANLESTPVLA